MFLSKSAGVLTVLTLAVGIIAAQDRIPRYRTFISDTTPPGIDTGMRDNDAPRPPRPYPVDLVSRSSGVPYLRGSIAVKFRPGTAPASQRTMVNRVGATAMEAPSYADFQIVTIDENVDPEAAATTLAQQPDVEFAQARYRVHPMFVPNDPLFAQQWNYSVIDMEHAWDLNPGATSSIIVAVLDSGVAYRNALLRRSIPSWGPGGFGLVTFPPLGVVDIPFAAAPDLAGPNRFVAPRDFIWDDADPLDLDGHGTHVAGTIGQLTNNGMGTAGMAFNVRIMPVKVIDSMWDAILGSPFEGTDDVVARGVHYAVDNGAKVLNLSIGRSGPASPLLQEAVVYATSRGAFVSIAAGNDFEQGNPTQWPAAYANSIQGAVAVGAIGRDRQRAYYSSTGPYVELVAPGGNQRISGTTAGILQQTYDFAFVDTYVSGVARYGPPRFDIFSYQFLQGTSMSAPHVSGFAALLMQQGITSPAAIEAAMEQFATDLGAGGLDQQYGYGLINPRASLRGLGLAK